MRLTALLRRTAIQTQHSLNRPNISPRLSLSLKPIPISTQRTMSSQSDLKTLEVLDASELKDGQQ
jgi:hypothetical protein